MKVKELVEILKQYPEDMMVVIGQCEGGFANVNKTYDFLIEANVHPEPYYIRHYGAMDSTKNATKVVVIM
jgi:hypothetical protein